MALPPRAGPLGLNAAFVTHTGDELVMKEKLWSLSGDSFRVMSVTNQPVVQVKGEAFSLSGRKHVSDMNGMNLFDIRKEHFSLFSNYYIEDANGQKLMEVKGKFSFGSSKATITFSNKLGKGEPVELSMKGDFFSRRAQIIETATGQPIAEIKKNSLNARNLLGGQQTYVVAIAPGVDTSLVVAMCVAFDERHNESSGGGGG